ncbi:Ankyrin repeat domain containing protein [Echinococcus multilocularis]|uniref:Ankyrin repeat domain containing protein n=1 Tax=Echinococcus multilocularis TaxID=6211 RepID=A0A087VZT6_ECHMU|nr:Ankyrin repeat domain containing protein [Echinococcus multilocularis]
MLEKEIADTYPLHYQVWRNDYLNLEELLLQKKYDIEALDPHGRTPLMLSVTLDHLESTRVLLRHNANACFKRKDYWSVTQEAISTGDPELLKIVLTHRDSHMLQNQAKIITALLEKLKATPDFYVEIKWEFTSWLPLVSRMCPSDICRVWKQGPNVRIDASLIGFNGTSSWVRGNMSYIFRITEQGVVMDEVNHSDRSIYRHSIGSLLSASASASASSPTAASNSATAGAGPVVGAGAGAGVDSLLHAPSDDLIAKKLTQPIFVTFLDTDKIEFVKSKSGMFGWGSDRKENINGHECQVCSAANVQIVTLRRTEHLTEENLRDIQESRANSGNDSSTVSNNPLTNLLGGQNFEKSRHIQITNEAASYNPSNITMEDYFSHDPSVKPKSEIGRPKVMTAKLKTYKAHLWLCEDYPLSLKDQVLPIVELMAEYNPFFHKLEEFLTKKLPPGFPMRVEIPLYHILNACVTFGNLYGGDAPAYGVVCHRTATSSTNTSAEPLVGGNGSSGSVINKIEPTSCVVEDCVFDVGRGYHLIEETSPGHFGTIDEEEQLVQMAVQRSLVEYGGAEHLTQRQYSLAKRGVVEARPGEYVDPEEAMMQEAIAESFQVESGLNDLEQQYLKALELSREEVLQEEERRKREEEELERVLKLSLSPPSLCLCVSALFLPFCCHDGSFRKHTHS